MTQPIKGDREKRTDLDKRISELKERFSNIDLGNKMQKRFGSNIIDDDVKKTVDEAVADIQKIDFHDIIDKFSFYATHKDEWAKIRDHHKCKRCGKEFYLRMPPKVALDDMGIFSWSLFVKRYAQTKGWRSLKNLNQNIVCPDCLKESDEPIDFFPDVEDNNVDAIYDSQFKKYKEWFINDD